MPPDAVEDLEGAGVRNLVIDRLAVPLGGQQSVGAHEVQVLAGGGLGQVESVCQFADGEPSAVEQFDNAEAMRMGQNAKGGGTSFENAGGDFGSGRTSGLHIFIIS